MRVTPFDQWTIRGRWWPTPRRAQRSSGVVIHHSVTTVGSSMIAAVRKVEEVIYARRFRSRFSMVAYSFLVTPDGAVWEGRGTRYRNGANNDTKRTGYGNAVTLSICFVGNYHPGVPGVATVHPTDAQIAATGALIMHLSDTGELHRGYRVVPHRHVHSTACPGDLLAARIDDIVAAASRHPQPPTPPAPVSQEDDDMPKYMADAGHIYLVGNGWHRKVSSAPSAEPAPGFHEFILPDMVAAGVSKDITDARKR